MKPEADMKIVSWINENLDATHSDLPIDLVRDWAKRTEYDARVHGYAVMGYMQTSLRDGLTSRDINARMAEYLEEFEAKLCLRLFQELIGVKLCGIPMFQIVGREKIRQLFREQSTTGKVLRHAETFKQ